MARFYRFIISAILILSGMSLYAVDEKLEIIHPGEEHKLIRVKNAGKYLLLPVEEKARTVRINIMENSKAVRSMDVRLAIENVDYYVPLDLSEREIAGTLIEVRGAKTAAICWEKMKISDTFDTQNREKHRPIYHFTPEYGWMNDPNGMVYKDGEYHLFYQYNPFGSTWGNMHWGHAVSKDLFSWEHLPVAVFPDALGAAYSGSCVVDANNTAGFGKGAIVAFYTSASASQTQSIAYSLDNGRTFKKYSGNPVLTSTVRDFRDPKVFWHEQTQRWIMILTAGVEMQIYSSANLKAWTYESSFGKGEGAHGGVWECPDLFELPVKGTGEKKWVLVCNLNPGGIAGGSATQYFVGTFDGHCFRNESPHLTKWMDWGKDHYAAVTWNNVPNGRIITLAWMSNWEYAGGVPTKQFRSANSVPRDLYLYAQDGETYMACVPSEEIMALREGKAKHSSFSVKDEHKDTQLLEGTDGAYEIELSLKNSSATIMGIELYNSDSEKVTMKYDMAKGAFLMDRRQSGKTGFSQAFPAETSAPITQGKQQTLRLLVDKASIEAFDGEGKFVMTNLVFPNKPYDKIRFFSEGGTYKVKAVKVYKLRKPIQ